MRKLVVNPDTPSAWEIPLNPGAVTLGRGEQNDVVIDHGSISSRHCVVNCGESVSVRDVGSSNGTFLNGELVEEAILKPGQTVHLGEVRVRYETDEPDASSPPPPIPVATPTLPAVSANCKFHPKNRARYSCPKCGLCVCELCVNTRREHGKMGRFCRACSVECIELDAHEAVDSTANESFARSAMGAFSYPLKGDGVFLLVMGGTVLLLIDAAAYFAHFAFIYGWTALLFLTVFGTGYLVSFLQRILTSSAAGENHVPDWPEITEFSSDLLAPFLQFLGTVAFCFAPAFIMMFWRIKSSGDDSMLGWMMIVSILASCVYFPMAFTAVAMFDTVMAVNPLLIIPSILKIPAAYLFTIVLFAGVLFVRWLGHIILPEVLHPRLLAWIFSSFFGLYLLIVEVRILGLLYRAKKVELGWFNR
jgi:hypothetical protein